METFPEITSTGPLTEYSKNRQRVLADTVQQVIHSSNPENLDFLIREALFLESQRMHKATRSGKLSGPSKLRAFHDKKLWNEVRSVIIQDPKTEDLNKLYQKILSHYAEEIGGHFSEKVYNWASRVVPWALSWLLNVANAKKLIPVGPQLSLSERLQISGEADKLVNLSQIGTVLLVPTHQSNIDSLIIGYLTAALGLPPFSYGAGLNLFSSPLLGFFMRNLGTYTVDRQKSNSIYKEVLKSFSSRILSEKVHCAFFPGGGRSRHGGIETHLKLGLLGTCINAQIENLVTNKPKGKIFVVPMTTSYHFVLESSSLIEEYLSQTGKSRFIPVDEEETFFMSKALKFFWDMFNRHSEILIRIGRPMDVFGNPVDNDGNSWGVNGQLVDISKLCTSEGQIKSDTDRDRVYTQILGSKIVDRYFCENTVLSSQAVSFAIMRSLRRQYPKSDLFHLLRLPADKKFIPKEAFMKECRLLQSELQEKYKSNSLQLSDPLKASGDDWIHDGLAKLGIFHSNPIATLKEDKLILGDMNLLYYYRNRLAGYDLDVNHEIGLFTHRGESDKQGFLA